MPRRLACYQILYRAQNREELGRCVHDELSLRLRSSASVPKPHNTLTVCAPAVAPVCTSIVVSPIIRHSCGDTPIVAAANRKGSGCGFIRRVV